MSMDLCLPVRLVASAVRSNKVFPPILRFTSLPNPERYHLSLNLFSLRPSLVKVGVHTIGFSDNPNYSRFCVRPGFLFVAPRHAVPGR